MSDSKETHKASFTVQASICLRRTSAFEIQINDFDVVIKLFHNHEIGNRQSAIANVLLLVSKFYGQATKGTRWMPWHFEAMKDVASCEKLRLGASIL